MIVDELDHWETTRGLAHLLDIPTGTVRRWAHEDRWRGRGTRRHRLWNYEDAQRSYDRRRVALDSKLDQQRT